MAIDTGPTVARAAMSLASLPDGMSTNPLSMAPRFLGL